MPQGHSLKTLINVGLVDINNRFRVLPTDTDLNNIKTSGLYYCNGVLNSPKGSSARSWGQLIVIDGNSETKQIWTPNGQNLVYMRQYTQANPSWSDWIDINYIYPSVTTRNFAGSTHVNASSCYDVQIGQIHVLNFTILPKQSNTTFGFEVIGTLPYKPYSQVIRFACSTWQNTGQLMGEITTNGDVKLAGTVGGASQTIEYRAQVVVITA